MLTDNREREVKNMCRLKEVYRKIDVGKSLGDSFQRRQSWSRENVSSPGIKTMSSASVGEHSAPPPAELLLH